MITKGGMNLLGAVPLGSQGHCLNPGLRVKFLRLSCVSPSMKVLVAALPLLLGFEVPAGSNTSRSHLWCLLESIASLLVKEYGFSAFEENGFSC